MNLSHGKDAETKRGQPGVNLGSTLGQPGVNLGSTWGQPGVNLGSTWGQPGFNLGSTWGQPGVNLHRLTVDEPALLFFPLTRSMSTALPGPTLVHFSAQLEGFVRDRGCA